MKYIRTKEGVYDLKLKPKYENDKKTIDFFVNNYYGGYNNFVKIADTIEALCDEFVIRYDDRTCETLNHDYTQSIRGAKLEQYNMELKYGNCDLFGAIWTDRGLIYVAKMNEKGELELL